MVEALAARDAAGLRAVLVGHLHAKRDVVLEQMRRIAADVKTTPAKQPRSHAKLKVTPPQKNMRTTKATNTARATR